MIRMAACLLAAVLLLGTTAGCAGGVPPEPTATAVEATPEAAPTSADTRPIIHFSFYVVIQIVCIV